MNEKSNWKTKTYRVKSVSPMLMHNGDLADPQNVYTIEHKKYSGKRKKTDDDFLMMSKIEFRGSLYVNENKQIVVPADNWTAILIEAAKKEKGGKLAKAGLFCEEHMVLEYEGEQDPEKLFEDKNFVYKKGVRVQSAKIIRTRPIFNEWAGEISVKYNSSLVNETQLDSWMNIAGEQIGVGDWRPRFGRFEVVAE